MTMAKAMKLSPENIMADWGGFEDWAAGTSVAPSGWTMTGTAGSVARESSNIQYGAYAMKIISGATSTYAAEYSVVNYDLYLGRTVRFGMWVKCSSASKARIYIDDGVTTTYSSYHTGGGSYEFLEVQAQVGATVTVLKFGCQVASNAVTAYFDSGVAVQGEVIFTQLNPSTNIWVQPDNISPSIKIGVSSFNISRREGLFIADTKLGEKTISMQIQLYGDTYSEVRAYYDSIVKAIIEGKKDFYQADDRVLKVVCIGISKIRFLAAFNVYVCDVNFLAGQPYEQYIGMLRSLNTIAASPTSFNLTVNGSYKTRPIITFKRTGGTITSCALQNLTTGQTMAFGGTVADGKELIIDCEQQTVLNDSVDKISDFTGQFIYLVPGTNYLKYTGSLNTLKVDWFDRWI